MKKTLVIGASTNPDRYSYKAIQLLKAKNIKIEAIGNKEGSVEGVPINTEKTPYKDIDTVTLYIGNKIQKDYYDYILKLQPKRVIFNPGTENPEFYKLLKYQNIGVEIACTLVLLSTNQY